MHGSSLVHDEFDAHRIVGSGTRPRPRPQTSSWNLQTRLTPLWGMKSRKTLPTTQQIFELRLNWKFGDVCMTWLRTPEIPNLKKIRFSPLFYTPLETEINLQMPVRSGWNIFSGIALFILRSMISPIERTGSSLCGFTTEKYAGRTPMVPRSES